MSQLARINVKNHLNQFLKRKTDRLNMRLESRCAGVMDRTLSYGVDRMAVANVIERPEKLMQVQDNLEELIECMAKHAREQRTIPEIGERAFEAAKREKGTLWPFF